MAQTEASMNAFTKEIEMKARKTLIPLLISVLACISLAPLSRAQSQGPPLRDYAERLGFYIGPAFNIFAFKGESDYRDTLKREFNILVPENIFKWEEIHPERNRYEFTGQDAMVDFAIENKMKIRGHVLVWHFQLPNWLKNGTFTRDEAIAILRDHIMTVAGRYKGKIMAWDVVNEGLSYESPTLRTDSFWYQAIGPDYIKLAFQFAHEADPGALLYYNETGAEGPWVEKAEAVYNLVQALKNEGVPIHGVGLQFHEEDGFRIRAEHNTNLKRLTALGLEVSVTESDVRMRTPTTEGDLVRQAVSYRDIIDFSLSDTNSAAFLTWGFTDKHSWIPFFFQGMGDALIFDAGYKPKPAYFALRDAFKQKLDQVTPQITGVIKKGKKLTVVGKYFDLGGQIFINGQKQKKVSNDPDEPYQKLIAKKSGKFVQSGDRIQVQSYGKLSNEFIYP